MGTGAENLLALIEFTHRLEYLVQTIFSDMKNKSVKLPFVTKNSKHLGETSAHNSSPLIEFTPL